LVNALESVGCLETAITSHALSGIHLETIGLVFAVIQTEMEEVVRDESCSDLLAGRQVASTDSFPDFTAESFASIELNVPSPGIHTSNRSVVVEARIDDALGLSWAVYVCRLTWAR
jgi:hypothetical protein